MKKDGSRNDAYVNDTLMIEARSCERFKVLSENIQKTLAKFYRDLMISEAWDITPPF
jgi:tRNA-(ms[2]io[6]A)-hydroxylase